MKSRILKIAEKSPETWIEDGVVYVRTMAKAARALDIDRRTLGEWKEKGCPGEHGRWPVVEIQKWRSELRSAEPIDGDPLMSGPEGGEWLEEYRKEKTLSARLDRMEKEKQFVRLENMRDGLFSLAAVIRSAGERIGRDYGPGPQEVLNEALQEFIDGGKQQLGVNG